MSLRTRLVGRPLSESGPPVILGETCYNQEVEEGDGPMLTWLCLAARNALKRKKQHEHSLEQTNGQISMLEQQIYSIESANINQETLVAMKNAGAAMKQIHGKMTMEDVDTTMWVSPRLTQSTRPVLTR